MIPVYKPYLPPNSLNQAHDALDSTWLSSQGKYIQIVQEKLQELLKVKYVLPLNNGTSACHLVAKIARENCSNCNVIVPNNVYIAAWNAFLFDKDWKLIPVDIDLDTWNYNFDKLDEAIKSENEEAVILVVHNIGNIVNVPALKRKYPRCFFVEDNCEGFLGSYENRISGSASFASSISFFGNKNITSGEGGAFITNDEKSYQLAKCLYGQGQSNKRFIHDKLGYNYRMTNIQAAILCGQLDILPTIMQMKSNIFDIYRQAFSNREDIKIQSVASDTKHSNWMFGVRIIGNPNYETAELYFKMNKIEIRPMFYSIFEHQYLNNNSAVYASDCTNAKLLNKESFILPSFPELTSDEQIHIIHTVNNYVKIYGCATTAQ